MINTLMLVSKKKGWIEAMKIQQRGAALLLCVALIVSALAGCGGKDGPAEQRPAADTVEYTNLNDSASRQLLERLLSDAGGGRRSAWRTFSVAWTASTTA